MSYSFELGGYSRPVTVASPEAQTWFDRGLVWCYGFNHEEAVECFRRAADIDPTCAMAYWGIAFASGPFYNLPWKLMSESEARTSLGTGYNSIQQALGLLDGHPPVEEGLICALSRRFQSDQLVDIDVLQGWDDAYADAMRKVHKRFPNDLDVIALFAEAMMTRTPWKLWDIHNHRPIDGADTLEVIAVLEGGLEYVSKNRLQPHLGMLHMYLHALEMSPTPEKALGAADQLSGLCPDAGHLQHMPAHIYVICGRYHDAIAVSEKAISADEKFLELAGYDNFYTTSMCHDLHMMMYASMFAGRYEPAITAAETMIRTLTADLLGVERPHMAATLEGYYSMYVHVLVRFGKWREIIARPLPADPELYCVSTAMCRYARSVAHSALGQIEAAEAEASLFTEAVERITESRFFFNNTAHDILAIGKAMMLGELEYRKENHDLAFSHLEQAVGLNDELYYTEPWAWMHPPRHALGALLLEQGRISEAEAVYRADLGIDESLSRPSQHPDNVWSLHGYVECLERSGKLDRARSIRERLDVVLLRSDQKITSSCACRTRF